MFEISAKAYCEDHKGTANAPKLTKGGKPKKLVEVLRGITKHITDDKSDIEKTKILHGAMTVLARPEDILSVTSMNQLVHNPKFSVDEAGICLLFGHVFPLLEEMNA